MNNSVFGKTMEDVRNRIKLHLTTDDKNAIRQFSKPLFKQGREIDGLYLIEMLKDTVVMNKPIYVGTSILDISKICMMSFHDEVIDKNFAGRYEYIYGDTDSCVYLIYTEDVNGWMKENEKYFDLTDDKIIRKFKDEMNGHCIESYCALNPKCHSCIHQSDNGMKNEKKCKGVSKSVVKNDITHADYKHTLDTGETLVKNTTRFQSIRQQVFTIVQSKKALSTFYDKFQMVDAYNNVPYGYIDATNT
jgi:hypothetical protein